MTINSETRVAGPFEGNDATVAFPFSFKVFADTEVLVVSETASIESNLVLGSDYYVSLNADQNAAPGGTVVLTAPLATGTRLTVTSALEYLQPVDLTNQGGFYPRVINNAFDRLTILLQQLFERLGRALVFPISDGQVGEIPGAGQRAGSVLAFHEVTGDPVVGPSIADVNTVAGFIGNVNTVATNIADVNTVATNIADVNTVAGNIADVNTVGQNIAAVNNVSTSMADVNAVADGLADVTNFADVYYGPSATDPTTRKDGSPLQDGDLYFNTASSNLRAYNGTAWHESVTGSVTVQNLSGNGVATQFTLNYAPESEVITSVFVSGVYQQKNTYELGGVGGDVLIFSEAPPAGADNIEVVVSSLTPSDDALRADIESGGFVTSEMVGFERSALTNAITNAGQMLSAQSVNIWEFAGHVTSKPTALDPDTWDWSPAVVAAFTYLGAAGVLEFTKGKFRISGVTSSKTISLVGRGAGVTELVNATAGATMFSYDQVGMSDKERRNWLKIEGMTIRDEASFTGTGVKTNGVLAVILRDAYLRDFKAGFGLQCLETLWAYLDLVHSDLCEIQFKSVATPHNNNVVCIRGGELRNPPAGKFGLYVENGDIVRLIDSTIEGTGGGAMTAGGKFKTVKMLSIENTYFEVLSTATEGGLSLEGCQAVNISGSQLNSQSTTVPSLVLNECDNVKLDRCVMVAFPIRAVGYNSIELNGCMTEGPQDISAATTLKVRSPMPYNTRSAIVTDPRFQPRNVGLPMPFRNTYADSSFETAAPSTTIVAGAPVSSRDTTQGYYDSNSWRVTGVSGDTIRSASLGTTSSAGQSGCMSFMAKADTAGRFTLLMFLDGSAGGHDIYLSTEWRRYFVITNLRPASVSGSSFLLQLAFTETNAFNIDDVQFVPFTDYGEIPGIVDGFNYLPTHGATIPGALSRTVFPDKVWFDRSMNLRALPVYADNAAATTGGLLAGDLYRTSVGAVHVRY